MNLRVDMKPFDRLEAYIDCLGLEKPLVLPGFEYFEVSDYDPKYGWNTT